MEEVKRQLMDSKGLLQSTSLLSSTLSSQTSSGSTGVTPRNHFMGRKEQKKWGKSLILPSKEDILGFLRHSTTYNDRENLFHFTDYEVIKSIWTANHRLSLISSLQQQKQGGSGAEEMPFLEDVVIELRSQEQTGKLTLRESALEDPNHLIHLLQDNIPSFLDYPECLPDREMRSLFINKMRNCHSWNELQAAVGTLLEQLILRQYSIHENQNASAKMEELLLEEEENESTKKSTSKQSGASRRKKKNSKKSSASQKSSNTHTQQISGSSSPSRKGTYKCNEEEHEDGEPGNSTKSYSHQEIEHEDMHDEGEDPPSHSSSALNTSSSSSPLRDALSKHDEQTAEQDETDGPTQSALDTSAPDLRHDAHKNGRQCSNLAVDPSASPVLIEVGREYGGAGIVSEHEAESASSTSGYSPKWTRVVEQRCHRRRHRYVTAPPHEEQEEDDDYHHVPTAPLTPTTYIRRNQTTSASVHEEQEGEHQPQPYDDDEDHEYYTASSLRSCNSYDPNAESERHYQERVHFIQMYQHLLNNYIQQSRCYPPPQIQAMAHAQAYAQVFGATDYSNAPAQVLPMHMYPDLMLAKGQVYPSSSISAPQHQHQQQEQGRVISVYGEDQHHHQRRLRANAAEFVPGVSSQKDT
eukprot:gb/GECG01000180.1/.p1 GENE.gb/GECG01000180.1/~~gb/GECG01000180.1/.p1  ORF type:complete len:638 (+),score=123.23 gb/GECG01000180.1/:1-1914(+)